VKNNFRVVIPRKVVEALILSGNVLNKHDSDGVDSILTGLDMAGWQSLHDFAHARNEEALAFDFQKELAIQERNQTLGVDYDQVSTNPGTVRYYIKSIRDYLMGLYRNNPQTLGLWGFEVNTSPKKRITVVIPRNADRIIQMTERVIAKHTADGVDTILTNVDMSDLADKLAYAKEQHELASEFNRLKEHAIASRNRAMGFASDQRSTTSGTILFKLCSARDVLIGHFRGMPHELGLWGYEVNTSLPPSNGNGNGTDPEPEITEISGVVRDANTEEVIGGVTVNIVTSIGNFASISNILGEFSTELELESSEVITIVVNHPGYNAFTLDHAVTIGIVNLIVIELTAE